MFVYYSAFVMRRQLQVKINQNNNKSKRWKQKIKTGFQHCERKRWVDFSFIRAALQVMNRMERMKNRHCAGVIHYVMNKNVMREGRGSKFKSESVVLFCVRVKGNEWRGFEKVQVECVKMIPYFQRFPFSVFIFHWCRNMKAISVSTARRLHKGEGERWD